MKTRAPLIHSLALPSLALAALLLAAGCKSDAPKPAPEVPTTGKKTPAEAEPAAAPQDGEPAKVEGTAVEAAAVEAAAAEVDEAAKAAVEVAEPAPPEDPVEEAIGAFEEALLATARCEKKPNSIRAKDQAACLKPVKEAKSSIRNPAGALAEAPDARQRLREGLAKLLMGYLDHEDPTLVLHTLMHNQADISVAKGLKPKLSELLEHETEDIAEWAAITRFWRRDAADEETHGLAKTLFAEHKHNRVRLAACQYLGDATFRGRRDHYELLDEKAKNPDQPPLIRSCAVTRLGYVGGDKDIKSILGYLGDPKTQYAALYALQRGLKSPLAVQAYVNWFDKNWKKDKAIHWGSLTIFVPKKEVSGFPAAKAARVLGKMAGRKDLHHRGRELAADGLKRLGAIKELKKLAKVYAKADLGDDAKVRKAVEEAIAELEAPEPAASPAAKGPKGPGGGGGAPAAPKPAAGGKPAAAPKAAPK